MLVKVDEQNFIVEFPYNIAKLRRDFKNVSFPKNPSDESLADFNVYRVIQLPIPAYDANTQVVTPASQPEFISGQWQLDWIVRAKLDIEIEREATTEFIRSVDIQRTSGAGLEHDQLRDVIAIIYTEAKAYQANNSVPTPGIQKLADTWGVTRGQALQRVINKYGSYIENICEKFAIREDRISS